MSLNLEEILGILKERDFSRFINVSENEYLEVKEKIPYDLSLSRGRFELAKDVSSFANHLGGYLLFGFKVNKPSDEEIEIISTCDFVREGEINLNQYQGVIREMIYPKIEGIEPVWIEDKRMAGQGIVCIHIPKQDEKNKMFLVNGYSFDEGKVMKGSIFSIYQRNRSDNTPIGIYKLHELFKKGMSDTVVKLIEINEKIDILLESKDFSLKSPSDIIDDRIRNIEEQVQ